MSRRLHRSIGTGFHGAVDGPECSDGVCHNDEDDSEGEVEEVGEPDILQKGLVLDLDMLKEPSGRFKQKDEEAEGEEDEEHEEVVDEGVNDLHFLRLKYLIIGS